MRIGRDTGQRWWQSSAMNMAALLAAYFAFPLASDGWSVRSAVGIVISLAGIGAVGYLIGRQIQTWLRGEGASMTVATLLLVLELVVTAFAAGYYVLATSGDQFIGLETRVDALYFTLTTVSTTGFGDIAATGQAARILVAVQIIFDLVILGAFVRVAQGRIVAKGDSKSRREKGKEG
jgi:voltage-gated potassium channel